MAHELAHGLSDAKPIRRADLADSDDSRSSSEDPAAVTRFLESTRDGLDFNTVVPALEADENITQDEEEGLQFRLFAGPAEHDGDSSTAKVQVVRIRSLSPDNVTQGFVQPHRSRTYYFTDVPSAARIQEYQLAAVSGQDIKRGAQTAWPGCAYPWKIIRLPATQDKIRQSVAVQQDTVSPDNLASRRTRLGKKARIKKRQAFETKKAKAKQEAASKEAAERAQREKKAQRNREKKFKKRARDKAKKIADQHDGAQPEPDMSDEG